VESFLLVDVVYKPAWGGADTLSNCLLLTPYMAVSAVALRTTLGVVLCWTFSAIIGSGTPDDEGKSLEWCAYTIIVVAAPTLGS